MHVLQREERRVFCRDDVAAALNARPCLASPSACAASMRCRSTLAPSPTRAPPGAPSDDDATKAADTGARLDEAAVESGRPRALPRHKGARAF